MSRTARPLTLRIAALGAGTVAALLSAGCGSSPVADRVVGMVTPYRTEIVQGNVVTREQLALVKPGMSRLQVRDALGSPLLTDIFHGDRWDYVFAIRRQGAEPQRRHIVLQFDGDSLKSIEAPELPTEREFVESITTTKAARAAVPNLELTEEQRKALPAPPPRAEAAAATPAPQGPARAYPPLEPAR